MNGSNVAASRRVSFAHDAFYVVRPRAELHARLQHLDHDDREPLLRAEGFRKREGSFKHMDAVAWTHELKLMFIAWLHDTYLVDAPEGSAFHETLRELLGAPPWSAETFDAWWSAERYEVEHIDAEFRRSRCLSKLTGPQWLMDRLARAGEHTSPSGDLADV